METRDSISTSNGAHSESGNAPAWEPEGPFRDPESGVGTLTATATSPATAFGRYEVDSPFRAEYTVGETIVAGPEAEHFASVLGELHDVEFGEAVTDLVHEGIAALSERIEGELGDPARDRITAERFLREFYEPVVRENTALLDRMMAGIGDRDAAKLSSPELEALLAPYTPSPTSESPAFNNFSVGFFDKVKKAVGAAANVAKKIGSVLPVGMVLEKLKPLVAPLIQRVLRAAIDRLPTAVRPIARQLAKRFLGAALPGVGESETSDTGTGEGEDDATGARLAAVDPAIIQREFDTMLAGRLIGGESFDRQAAVEEAIAVQPSPDAYSLRELEAARDRFARTIVNLEPGESPQPAVEQFLPALLAAAKLAIKVIGRPRVIDTLAKLVGQLITKYVGKESAIALSRSLVDTGLGLIGLETRADSDRLAAGYTLASTVEGTVNHLVANAPASAWGNETLLEAYALEAFERAAAAAFPDSHIRPELHETATAAGAWVMVPAWGSYLKYTLVPQVTLTPQIAAAVKTFGGVPLATVLRDQLGLDPMKPIQAQMHMYEALAGTTLSRITLQEKRIPGLGSARREVWSQLHPLTPEAAGLLLKEPGLGKQVDPKFLEDRSRIAVGQRVYYLEIPGARPRIVDGGRPGVRRGARTSQVNVIFDFPKSELRVLAYFSEADAQTIAGRLRWKENIGAVLAIVRSIVEVHVKSIVAGTAKNRLRVVHEAQPQQEGVGAAGAGGFAAEAVMIVLKKILENLVQWVMDALRHEIEARWEHFRADFVKATQDPADGVTAIVTFPRPSFFDSLRRWLPSPLRAPFDFVALARSIGESRIEVKPGFVM